MGETLRRHCSHAYVPLYDVLEGIDIHMFPCSCRLALSNAGKVRGIDRPSHSYARSSALFTTGLGTTYDRLGRGGPRTPRLSKRWLIWGGWRCGGGVGVYGYGGGAGWGGNKMLVSWFQGKSNEGGPASISGHGGPIKFRLCPSNFPDMCPLP